jgi:hypothetical protein
MRLPALASQSEIDAQLRRAKPRERTSPPLPWGPALIGLSLLMVLQTWL